LDELSETGRRARRRIARRLIPFLFILYIIAYLDRVNVSFATLEMSQALGFSDRVFGLGAGIFFIGYFILEIPGALIVERWSARRWIARIMISWGLITVLMAFLETAGQFYTARFLLGAAEAGFFPGIIVYLTHWFRYEDRAKAVAMFMSAIPISNVLGSPVAGLLMRIDWFGYEGWRWLFVLEGIPAVILGVVTLAFLTDRPQQAKWLPEDERQWIIAELEKDRLAKQATSHYSVWQALGNRDVLLLAAVYFFGVTGHYGLSLWLPTILQRVSGMSTLAVTLLAMLPYGLGLGAMLWNGWHSDRHGERRWHATLPLLVAALALGFAAQYTSLGVSMALFSVASACLLAYLPCFWALPTITLGQSAAAAAIGMINSVGNLGGFAGPFVMGYLRESTQSFAAGFIYLASGAALSGALILLLRVHRRAP
jgi:D-galactonate transporter